MKHHVMEVEAGCTIDEACGRIVKENPYYMASRILYRAKKDDRIVANDQAFLLNVATYGNEVPEEYMYTYMYEPEQNWSCYRNDYREGNFSIQDYVFSDDCWFRICLKKQDGNWCIPEDAERINEIISLHSLREDSAEEKPYFKEEIRSIADRIHEKAGNGKSLVFALLSDSHYVVNGTWEDTVNNIKKVHQKVGFDGIIHLGDLQDGMLDKKMCRRIASKCINDMRNICEPLYLAIGNHDTNYFKGNPQWLTAEEQYGIYGRFQDRYVKREGVNGYYYVDYEHVALRMLFLSSFDHREKLRYGFPEEEVAWVKQVLDETPFGYKVLVFSHDAPLARLDYWASDIRNGEYLMEVLERYNGKPGNAVLAYIHGHTHADYVYTERDFPIISIGCSKCEYFSDKKPEGSVRSMRKLNGVTQDLWDALIITPDKKSLEFVRFGAGEDRLVKQRTKVWGHRGASGYAPENTLEAFRLAAEMGADGVELDVQITKDGELVVAHDERIDRVSDGSGLIADYTLEELKQFNFNKTHPEFAEVCRIPTLREVFWCLKDTGLTVNIELKTGVNFYPGIEEKVVCLVREMGYENRVLYSSFNHHSVLNIRKYEPEAKLAFLHSHQLANAADYAISNQVFAVNPSVSCTRYEEEIAKCQRQNVDVNVWTVNSEEEMRRLGRIGVNAVITNYPNLGKKIMNEL